MTTDIATRLIEDSSSWFAEQADVEGVLLVGSYARGNPRPNSDIDLVILSNDQEKYLKNIEWTRRFGEHADSRIEDWGALRSVRISYQTGPEIEFGITSLSWACVSPVDQGTLQVVKDAAKILYDKNGKLKELLSKVLADRSVCELLFPSQIMAPKTSKIRSAALSNQPDK
jgi:uncharacterized protein